MLNLNFAPLFNVLTSDICLRTIWNFVWLEFDIQFEVSYVARLGDFYQKNKG